MTAQGATALAALSDDEFGGLVRASVGIGADAAVWEALTDPVVISRTRVTLVAINVDIEGQLSVGNAALQLQGGSGKQQSYFDAKAEQAEWRRRALAFRRLVQRRLAFVKARTPRPPQQPTGSKLARRSYQDALERLARAVADHRDHVLSGSGSEDDDDALWDQLDQLTVTHGNGGEQAVSDWLAYLDRVREDDDL